MHTNLLPELLVALISGRRSKNCVMYEKSIVEKFNSNGEKRKTSLTASKTKQQFGRMWFGSSKLGGRCSFVLIHLGIILYDSKVCQPPKTTKINSNCSLYSKPGCRQRSIGSLLLPLINQRKKFSDPHKFLCHKSFVVLSAYYKISQSKSGGACSNNSF